MITAVLKPYQPSFLILFVTSKCNARCSFCFYGDRVSGTKIKEQELTSEEFKRISERCGKIPYLLISGGEPILRDDIVRIVGYFIENAGVQYVTIPSNGLLPENTERAFDFLTKTYPKVHFRAAFSVDFPDERHDESRGISGCLEGVLEGAGRIRKLKKERVNLSLDIVTVFMHKNCDLHPILRDWVKEKINPDNHELHLLRMEWPEPIPKNLDLEVFLSETTKYMELGRKQETRSLSAFFRGLNDVYIGALKHLVKGKRVSNCFAGRKITVIDETGNVKLCELRPEVLGNLRSENYNLISILKKSRKLLREINRRKCSCTWECSVSTNIVCTTKFYPRLLAATVREYFKWRREK